MNGSLTFYHLFYLFLIYSFLGWVTEVIYAYIIKKRFINRGFLHGPFCPIYGFGAICVHYLLTSFASAFPAALSSNVFLLFFYVFFITSAIEYLTGFVLEKIFHTKWWDYSDETLNINGYICLKFSIIWGVAGTIILKTVHVQINGLIDRISQNTGYFLMYLLLLYFTVDTIFTVKQMIGFKKIITELEDISIQLKEKAEKQFKDNLEEIRQEVMNKIEDKKQDAQEARAELIKAAENTAKELSNTKNKLLDTLQDSYQSRLETISRMRLFLAFPDMKSVRYKKIFENIKKIHFDRIRKV